MVSSMTIETYLIGDILTPDQVCGDVASVLDGVTHCERSGYTHAFAEQLCFKVFETKLTWHDSRDRCEEDHGRLIVFMNSIQTEYFMNLGIGNLPRLFWIGLSNPDKNSNWRWVDGSTFSSSVWHLVQFNGYDSGFPREPFSADCAALNQYSKYIIDSNCKANMIFVCERPQLL
ncbi:C-type lectin domain family 4 member M-like [Pecten maximus]|uniref:C-type lectin domain family 4 member M-like n=1 Tax=Pecten maximus TaxID=6579 RepID=UPI001458B19C|nr:C-type lectin domain family 4 member M-like [Pecten maximus]